MVEVLPHPRTSEDDIEKEEVGLTRKISQNEVSAIPGVYKK